MSTLTLPAAALLGELCSLGVQVSRRGDVLDLDAPRGVLTPQVLADLRAHKAEFLQVLEATPPQQAVPAEALERARVALGPRVPEAEVEELAVALMVLEVEEAAWLASGSPRRHPDQADAGELYRQAQVLEEAA